MMPQPPGKAAACRAGNGFQISKTRKSIKPSSKYFQFTGVGHRGTLATCAKEKPKKMCPTGGPPKKVINCPEISSMTTICGSLAARYRSEEHTSELQSRGHLVC